MPSSSDVEAPLKGDRYGPKSDPLFLAWNVWAVAATCFAAFLAPFSAITTWKLLTLVMLVGMHLGSRVLEPWRSRLSKWETLGRK